MEKKKQMKKNPMKQRKQRIKGLLPAPKTWSTHSEYLGRLETALLGFVFASESSVGLGPYPDYEN